jgi:hypothetical protein
MNYYSMWKSLLGRSKTSANAVLSNERGPARVLAEARRRLSSMQGGLTVLFRSFPRKRESRIEELGPRFSGTSGLG